MREQPLRHVLHRDREFAIIEAGADRIAAPDLCAAERCAQRQELTRSVGEGFLQIIRHIESDADGISAFTPHRANAQRMEFEGRQSLPP